MKSFKNILLFLLVSLLFGSCTEKESSKPLNIVFVKNNELIEKFEMTNEVSEQSLSYFNKIQQAIDSLKINIEKLEFNLLNDVNLSDAEKNKRFDYAYNSFLSEKGELENKIATREQENQILIIKRLNTYIEQYANELNYDLIIGSKGDGSILYGKEHIDITESLISYVNAKYQNN